MSIPLPHKPGDKVTVVMELDRSTKEIIKSDSVASIETEGMLGNQFVAISFGSAGQAEVKNGETIQSEPPLVMADMLKKTSGILDSSQQAIQNATLATAHLNSVSAKIDSGQGTVGALVNDKQLYNNLEQTTATLARHDDAGTGRRNGLPGEYGSLEAQLLLERVFQEARIRRLLRFGGKQDQRATAGYAGKDIYFTRQSSSSMAAIRPR